MKLLTESYLSISMIDDAKVWIHHCDQKSDYARFARQFRDSSAITERALKIWRGFKILTARSAKSLLQWSWMT